MKRLLFILSLISIFSVSALKAQTKAAQDNNQFVAVAQTTGANHQTHYKMTNNNSVSMDFSLYKEMKDGSWGVTHHLDLKPSETYEDVNGFTGYTGKYVVYSAPHSAWASFPNAKDIPGLAGSGPALPPSPDSSTPATATAAPATPTPSVPAATPAPPTSSTPSVGRPDPFAPAPAPAKKPL